MHNHPVDMAEIKGHKIRSQPKTKAQETAQSHIEGWHDRLNKIVGKAHLNVYELVKTFYAHS